MYKNLIWFDKIKTTVKKNKFDILRYDDSFTTLIKHLSMINIVIAYQK